MNTDTHLDELVSRWQQGHAAGQDLSAAELCQQNPELLTELEQRLGVLRHMQQLLATPDPLATSIQESPSDGHAIAPPPTLPGYEILGELGRGGMGVVYKARQIGLNRLVALKVILDGTHASAPDLHRFRTEAEAIARLQHPHIVQIHEIGEHEGRPFFSLEFCPGGSLDKKLAGNPLTAHEAARLVALLAQAMHTAHEAGVVHCDLKPANVLLAEDGTPKVTDFGLAKKLGDAAGQTQSGHILGTPSYMAPEQAAGTSKLIGPTTDVYALGAILYDCLTGRPPFRAASVLETLTQVIADEPAPPTRLNPGTPRDLETICLKCLQKDPKKRYGSAAELAEELERFQKGEPIRARPVGPAERGWRWCRRNPAVAASLFTVALSLLAATGISLLFGFRAEWARQDEAARALSEAAAKQDAEKARHEAQRQVIDLCSGSGLTAAQESDHSLALLWFARAVQVAKDDRQQEQLNRIRFANWLRQVCLPEGSFTIANFRVRGDRFRTLAFSPDGDYLLATASTEDCLVWDRPHSRFVPLPGEAAKGVAAAWQPGSGVLAVAGMDGRIRFLAPPAFQVQEELEAAKGVAVLGFSRDGKKLAWGGREGARVWNKETRKYVTDLLPHSQPVTALSFSAAGDLLTTSARDLQARVFRVEEGTGEPLFPPVPHAGNLSGSNHGGQSRIVPRFADADRVLLTVERTGDTHVLVWRSATTGEVLPANVSPPDGGFLGAFAVSPQGNHVVAFWDHGGRLLEARAQDILAAVPTGREDAWCEDVAFAEHGKTVVTGGQDGLLRFWSVDDRRNFNLTETLPAVHHPTTVVRVGLSGDGRHAATALWDGRVCLWRLPEGPPPAYAIPLGGRPTALAQSPDRRFFLPRSTSYRGATLLETRVYQAETGKSAGPALSPGGILIDAAFSPDGTRVATASSSAQTPAQRNEVLFAPDGGGGNVQVWDWKSGKRLAGPVPTPGEPRGLAFRPDGKSLAVVCADYRVLLVDPATGTISHHLDPGARSRPQNANFWWSNGEARFSPDGRFFVTWELAPAVHVWDSATGQLLHTLPHNDRVEQAEFNPAEPHLLATGGRDSLVRVWDLESGRLVSRMPHPNWTGARLGFSPDGKEIISSCTDGMLRVWDWKEGRLKEGLSLYPNALVNYGFTADRCSLVSIGLQELQVTDWQTKTPCSPQYKLPWGPNFALALSDGDSRAIVGGFSPAVMGYDLIALLTPAPEPAENLVRMAEVVSSRRILNQGRIVPLTGAEWGDRWQQLRGD
jgi:WD40 repeat protein